MDFDGANLVDEVENNHSGVSASSDFSRFNVVVINFLLVRILIPHVILQPWNVGIGSKNIGKQASANLASLATLLYCVCRQLSPLPPPADSPETSFLARRRSKTIATTHSNTCDKNRERDESSSQNPNGIDPALTPPEPQEEEHSADISFLSIDEIGRRLIPDKNFPSNDAQVIQVVKEHQVMLQETLTHLHFQLHGSHGKL